MPALNLNIRRTRNRTNDLFGECSDDDLMSWGQALVDAEPFLDDEFSSTVLSPVAAAEPEPSPAPAPAVDTPAATRVSTARTLESVLVKGARLALTRRR